MFPIDTSIRLLAFFVCNLMLKESWPVYSWPFETGVDKKSIRQCAWSRLEGEASLEVDLVRLHILLAVFCVDGQYNSISKGIEKNRYSQNSITGFTQLANDCGTSSAFSMVRNVKICIAQPPPYKVRRKGCTINKLFKRGNHIAKQYKSAK